MVLSVHEEIYKKKKVRAFALSRFFGFSASSDDDEKLVSQSEIVPKASSERSRKTSCVDFALSSSVFLFSYRE